MDGTNKIGERRGRRQSWAELEGGRDGRLQRRRKLRHPVAEHGRSGCDLGDGRDQHDRQRRAASNPGPSWKAVGTGDFNGDGKSDILLQNTDGQVAIWEMNGTNMIGSGTGRDNPGPSWHAIGTGGGGSDILFQNTSGQIIALGNARKRDSRRRPDQPQSWVELACDRADLSQKGEQSRLWSKAAAISALRDDRSGFEPDAKCPSASLSRRPCFAVKEFLWRERCPQVRIRPRAPAPEA